MEWWYAVRGWLHWWGKEWGALATAVASTLAAWISLSVAKRNARFQSESERRKRTIELFDKRFDVYRETQQFIDALLRVEGLMTLPLDLRAYTTFSRTREMAKFLFGPEVLDFHEHLYALGRELMTLMEAVREAKALLQPSFEENRKVVDLIGRMGREPGNCQRLFAPYLKLYSSTDSASSMPASYV